MKNALLFALASVAALATSALADQKSDAILKESRLRAANLKTYSVTMEMHDGKRVERIVVYLERPGKFRIEVPEDGKTNIMVLNGDEGGVIDDGDVVHVPASVLQKMIPEIVALSLGDIARIAPGGLTTTYVTHKMLDETTVVDVIDVGSAKAGKFEKARLYIDNNGQIRKMAGIDNDRSSYILFLNPQADEPIPAEKFSLPKEK